MPYWNDKKTKKLIDTIPQLRQDNYDDLKHILLLHSKHLQRCEKIVQEEHDLRFERDLQWESQSMYNLYMDLVFDNEVCLKNRSLFRYKKLTPKDLRGQEVNLI